MPTTRLLFVDTNIWLDFYRSRTDAGLSLLDHLEAIKDRIIITYQVEIEFKNNRQKVIEESLKALQPPSAITPPRMISDAKKAKSLLKNIESAQKHVSALKARLQRALANPAANDPVYKICQRCFHKNDEITLSREHGRKRWIERKAFRRFLHGCPPRKRNDTSIGDAINWEWIVECAGNSQSEIHIVSRDADYGITIEGKSYLNDHLRQETEILQTKFTYPKPDDETNDPFKVWVQTGVPGSGLPTTVTIVTDPSEIVRRYHAATGAFDGELGN